MRCITFEELRAVVDQAHAAGLLVTAHAHPLTAIRDAVAAGVDAIEHGTFVTETGIEVPDAVVASLVGSAIALCSALGKAPGMRLTPAALKFMRKIGMAYRCGHTVGQLHRARVYIVSGSDGGINPSRRQRHGALPEAVIDLVHGGVCTADALASATALAATACGVGDRKGRLAADFAADLLLVDGDPLAISLPSETRQPSTCAAAALRVPAGSQRRTTREAPLTPTRIQVSGGNV